MKNRVTMSQLDRLVACPAHARLDWYPDSSQSEAAARGTEIHKYLEQWLLSGQQPDMPAEYRSMEAPHTVTEEGWSPEQAYALRPEPAEARCLGHVTGRNYGAPNTVICGTADVVHVRGEHVHVADYKTGRTAPFAWESWQLRGLAVAAAIAHGCKTATIEILHLQEDLSWLSTTEELDSHSLRDHLTTIQRVWRAVTTAKPRQGDHCRWCPAYVSCPAKAALALSVGAGDSVAHRIPDSLTRENLPAIYEKVKAAEELLGHVKAAVDTALHMLGPIDLGDGKILVRDERSRETLDARAAMAAVRAVAGPAAADEVATVTKRSLYRGLVKEYADAVVKQLRNEGKTRQVPYWVTIKRKG